MSPADIIRQLLIDNSLGTAPATPPAAHGAWPVFVNHYPDAPDEVLFLTDTAPILDGRESRGGKTIEHPGVQLIVRGRVHSTAWAKAEAIKALFDTILMEPVNFPPTTEYLLAAVHHRGIVAMGQEPDKRRSMYSVNMVMTYELVTA